MPVPLRSFQLFEGDCLEIMPLLPARSVDLILSDLPYGTTACKWDSIIPFEPLWRCYKQLCEGAMIFTATQPFTSALVMSNLDNFKYDLIWKKNKATGHLNAKKQPLRDKEDIVVFYEKLTIYNPQMGTGVAYSNSHKPGDSGDCYGQVGFSAITDCTTRYPRQIVEFAVDMKAEFHPTQKPVALMEYLIKTYTNPGAVVLDNCMGSGTTGVACVNTGREFIGIERDPGYFKIASERILEARFQKALRDAGNLCPSR